jgi:hypothetical protein
VKDNEKAPKKRRKITISGVLLLLLLIGICAFAIFRLRVKWMLNTRIEAIRATGYPATCDELDAWYAIPMDAENAAVTFLDAFAFLRTWDKTDSEALPLVGRAELPARTEPLADETKALIAEYIADNNDALELIRAGVEIEHCRYPVDFRSGFAANLDHLSPIRRSVMLLNLEALLYAENGEADAAVRSVLTGFGLARSLSKEPSYISQLVRMACHGLNLKTLEHVMNRTDLTNEQLIELSECLSDAERTSDMTCALAGERCMGLHFFTSPTSLDPAIFGNVPARPILALCKAIGFVDMDGAIYLDLMNEYIEAEQLPCPQRRKAVDVVNDKYESTSKLHIFVHSMMPAFSRISTIELRNIAKLRAARAGLAVQRYRLSTGRFPKTLEVLVPQYLDAVPKDPFDGNDLRYVKSANGFVIYSINDDLNDDGGAEQVPRSKRPKGQPAPNWDVTFIVER